VTGIGLSFYRIHHAPRHSEGPEGTKIVIIISVGVRFLQDSPITKIFLCVLCVIVYRHFCFKFLTVYSAKHREYQPVAKSTVPCFFNSCYFHNVDFFQLVCRRCAPGIGGGAQRKFGRHASRRSLCPPTSKTCRRL